MADEQVNVEAPAKASNPLVIAVVVVVLLLVGIGIYMMSKGSPSTETQVTESSTITENQTDSMMEEGTSESGEQAFDAMNESDANVINIEAGSFYYEPKVITVKLGQTVKIVMTSVDMMHDFNIDELGVVIPVTQSGETAEVEFVPSEVGEFEFYCSVGQHRAQGQVGTLIVEAE